MRSRVLLLVAGVLLATWGAWKLAAFELLDLRAVALWLAGGVFAHDALIAPLTLGLALAARALPRWWRAPAAVGLLVLGSVTLLAIPVLGRLGAKADNPTLLDRNYLLGWAILAGLTVAAVAVAGWRRRAASRGGGSGDDPLQPGDPGSPARGSGSQQPGSSQPSATTGGGPHRQPV